MTNEQAKRYSDNGRTDEDAEGGEDFDLKEIFSSKSGEKETDERLALCDDLIHKEITAEDMAQLLNVSRKSAVQRLYRLTQKHQAVRLNTPKNGEVCRYKILVSAQELLDSQKFLRPKQHRDIDWGKFCSDPFGMAKKEIADETN